MRVLIVDASRAVRSRTRRLLLGLGFDVVEAASGREGLEQLDASEPPTIALVSAARMEMDAAEFVRVVRALPARDITRVMVLTGGERGLDEVARALDAGANEYLVPPFDRRTILHKLDLMGIDPDLADTFATGGVP